MKRYYGGSKYNTSYKRKGSNNWIWLIIIVVGLLFYNQSQKSDSGVFGFNYDDNSSQSSESYNLPEFRSDSSNQVALPSSALSWNEAEFHVGEYQTVCGNIIATFDDIIAAGHHYLYMGHNYGNPDRFTVLIRQNDLSNFTYKPSSHLAGKMICATGKIETFRGVPEIEVETPTAIDILD